MAGKINIFTRVEVWVVHPLSHHVDNHFFSRTSIMLLLTYFLKRTEALSDRLSIYLLYTIMYWAILLFIL